MNSKVLIVFYIQQLLAHSANNSVFMPLFLTKNREMMIILHLNAKMMQS